MLFKNVMTHIPLQPAPATTEPIALRWLGGASMELKLGEVSFLTDPCFGDGPEAFEMIDPNQQFDPQKGPEVRAIARHTPFAGVSFKAYDALLLSHAHEDHFDETAQSAILGQGPLICPAFDVVTLKEKGFDAHPLAHGETRSFTNGTTQVDLMALPAFHSCASDIADMLGPGNGYFITVHIGREIFYIYWTGDSFLTPEVKEALSGLPAPDLFIPHIGAVGRHGTLGQISMSAKQALEAAAEIRAKQILPIHHSTFSHYVEPLEAMDAAHRQSPLSAKVTLPKDGSLLPLRLGDSRPRACGVDQDGNFKKKM